MTVMRDGMTTSLMALVGRPGAGKGTQARLLGESSGMPILSTGDLLRRASAEPTPLGRAIHRYVSRGFLVPSRLVLELVARSLEQLDGRHHGVILDGVPRNIRQALALEALSEHGAIDLVVELVVPVPAASARLAARCRSDDEASTVRRRMEVYERSTLPMVEWFDQAGRLVRVDADQPPELVHARVREITAPILASGTAHLTIS